MQNKNIKAQPYRVKRFLSTLFATQILILVCALNAFLLSHNFVRQERIPHLIGLRIDVFIYIICAFFSIMVMGMALNHEHGWFEGMVTTGPARMIDMLILQLISVYLAWVLGNESKKTMIDLRKKHLDLMKSNVVIQELADTDPLTYSIITWAMSYSKLWLSD